MWESYAKILGHHVARILSHISGGGPFTVRYRDPPPERPVYELAVRIDFEGRLTETRQKVYGYLICGLASFADSRPLLTDVAAYLGVGAAVLETKTGPQDILNEFINIVIGLAEANWTEHGFEISFSTPISLSGRIYPPPSPHDQAFRLAVSAETGPRADILVVFSERGQPAV
ncbi:MAG: hypothetical protein LBV70_06885 [Candidatus Adiutrix sp.]|jgi:hypothetical protein|nr:hypothetical protein [Candidatus Adiutrix sp.]